MIFITDGAHMTPELHKTLEGLPSLNGVPSLILASYFLLQTAVWKRKNVCYFQGTLSALQALYTHCREQMFKLNQIAHSKQRADLAF